MVLSIGKLYKLTRDGTAFFSTDNDTLIRKNAGELVLYIEKYKFLDLKNNIVVHPTSMLMKEPTSYLYLLV